MNPSLAILNYIQYLEKCVLKPYLCPGNYKTIGYGHLIISHDSTLKNITKSLNPSSITHSQALKIFHKDIQYFTSSLNDLVPTMYQHQFDALISLTFNIGVEAFTQSTLLKLIKQKLWEKAGQEFIKWCHIKKVRSQGLLRRRATEMWIFQNHHSKNIPHLNDDLYHKSYNDYLKYSNS